MKWILVFAILLVGCLDVEVKHTLDEESMDRAERYRCLGGETQFCDCENPPDDQVAAQCNSASDG